MSKRHLNLILPAIEATGTSWEKEMRVYIGSSAPQRVILWTVGISAEMLGFVSYDTPIPKAVFGVKDSRLGLKLTPRYQRATLQKGFLLAVPGFSAGLGGANWGNRAFPCHYLRRGGGRCGGKGG